jgi:glycosyltransferase involved in cell wall biosynthesis
MAPIVTIGMCCRNSEELIGAAIESIGNQDFPHEKMQFVLVDDGSEDRTLSVARHYISKIDVQTKIFQTKWRGLGPARNLILNNADGEYIIWVDTDEILTKSYVRKQVEFMDENPQVGITSGLVNFDSQNIVLTLEHIPDVVNRLNYGKPRSKIWKTQKLPGTGAATFRVKALKQVNGFDQRLKGVGEDQDVAKRIEDAGWYIKVNEAKFFELHGGMTNFKDLWKKYQWYGQGCQVIYCRDRRLFSLPRMSPPAGFLAGLFYSLVAYKLFRQKKVFLLPIHYCFKLSAWMMGFLQSQMYSYISSR